MASSCLRNKPDPLQGASTTIASKKSGSREKSLGSLFVTTVFAVPHLTRLCTSGGTRVLITSLLTNKLSAVSTEASKVLFPPGKSLLVSNEVISTREPPLVHNLVK